MKMAQRIYIIRTPENVQCAYIHFLDDRPVSRMLKLVMPSLFDQYV